MESISNLIFEFNDAQILFGMFQGFKKATPYGGARKLRLTHPPVRREEQLIFGPSFEYFDGNFGIFYETVFGKAS